jgi:hypothetical protein
MELLLGADDQVAMGCDGLEMSRHRVGANVARLARAVACEAPEIWSVIDVPGHPTAGVPRRAHGLHRHGIGGGGGEVGAGDAHGTGGGDEGLVHVRFAQRHVGAVLAVEHEGEIGLVAHAEQDEGTQPLGIGAHAAQVDALATELLADEAAHGLVAYRRDQARSQTEPGRADGGVGGAAAHRLGEGAHVLQAAADLLAVEIDRRSADGDHVEGGEVAAHAPASGTPFAACVARTARVPFRLTPPSPRSSAAMKC